MNRSRKEGFTLVEIMIVVVIIGLLAAIAVPAYQKVRAASQNNAITNNLRQFAAAAQQYMMETGATSANYTNIVGVGKWLSTIESIATETYTGVTLNTNTTEISVTGPNGNVVFKL